MLFRSVYFNKIQEKPEGEARDRYVAELRAEYREDIDLYKLASELVVDAVVPFEGLRQELSRRFARLAAKHEGRPAKHHLVTPV